MTGVASPPSAFRAWCALVVLSFQRHWRVRQMGWVSAGLLGLVLLWVIAMVSRGGWDVENYRSRQSDKNFRPTNRQDAERLLPTNRYRDLGGDTNRALRAHEMPHPLNPTADAITSLVLSIPHAAVRPEVPITEPAGDGRDVVIRVEPNRFLLSRKFMLFSRWAVNLVFLGFVLPLFTLTYASGAFGTERESRSLVWLMTRPIPRGGIYLAKFLGTLPWCLLFGLVGFVAICFAGGAPGAEALTRYWPAAVAATVAFAALFHLVGAVFRRPVVVGLVYVFFFETVVSALPGSLKLLSLTFYARSLIYNEAVAAGYPGEMLPAMGDAVSSTTAWAVLLVAPVAITLVGMWLFARSEYRDDV